MAAVPPVVRYLIVCENVRADPGNPRRISAINLIANLYPAGASYPAHLAEMVALCILTEGRGSVQIRVEISKDQDPPIFRSSEQSVVFSSDLLAITAVSFRIRDLVFPTPGVYEVKLLIDGVDVANQLVRAR